MYFGPSENEKGYNSTLGSFATFENKFLTLFPSVQKSSHALSQVDDPCSSQFRLVCSNRCVRICLVSLFITFSRAATSYNDASSSGATRISQISASFPRYCQESFRLSFDPPASHRASLNCFRNNRDSSRTPVDRRVAAIRGVAGGKLEQGVNNST